MTAGSSTGMVCRRAQPIDGRNSNLDFILGESVRCCAGDMSLRVEADTDFNKH